MSLVTNNISGSVAGSSRIGITGSVIFGNAPSLPVMPGTDISFFVSGSRSGKADGNGVSVFGGDAVISGALTIGTGSIYIDSNEIRFQGGLAKIVSGSTGLTFFDSSTPAGVTLGTLVAGAGGGDVDGPASSTATAVAVYADTSGKLLANSGVTIDGSNNVIIPGNLTVNGSTVTLDVQNLLVEDKVIIIASGAAGPNDGGIAIFSGSSGGKDLVFGKVASDTWGFGEFDTQNGTLSNWSTFLPKPVRAGHFQLNTANVAVTGTDGGAGLMLSASVLTLLHGEVKPVKFVQNTSTYLSIEPKIVGTNEGSITSPNNLWLSGTTNYLKSTTGQSWFEAQTGGAQLLMDVSAGGNPRVVAGLPGGTSNPLTLSGSIITLGANTGGVVNFHKSGSQYMQVFSDAGGQANIQANATLVLRGNGASQIDMQSNSGQNYLRFDGTGANAKVFNPSTNQPLTVGTLGTGNMTVSGSRVNINFGGLGVIQRDGIDVLLMSHAGTQYILSGSANTNVTFGSGQGATTMLLSGSTVSLQGGRVEFKKDATTFAFVGTSPDAAPLNGLFPNLDNTYNLGSPDRRWANIYTGDLHLKNDRGDYTLIEEADCLTIRFNKTGKRYRFVLEPAPEFNE